MSTPQLPSSYRTQKSFWKRPEGITGAIFGVGILALIAFIAVSLPWGLILANTVYMAATAAVVFGMLFMILDPKMRQLIWYGYQSAMRKVTGAFVKIDPIGILKSYVEDMESNLKKMNAQINQLRGQMHKLDELIKNNSAEIDTNMRIASQARAKEKPEVFTLKTRRAGRLRDSNVKLTELYKKMEILYRVLDRMYRNGEILIEDVRDQVQVKEQERKAIRASHGAMQSASRVMGEDKDARRMYDQALEHIADDLSAKVGEMERFMEMSSTFMDSVDLNNGLFEEKGMEMLDQWERETNSRLLAPEEKTSLLREANDPGNILDVDAPRPQALPRESGRGNQYDALFK